MQTEERWAAFELYYIMYLESAERLTDIIICLKTKGKDEHFSLDLLTNSHAEVNLNEISFSLQEIGAIELGHSIFYYNYEQSSYCFINPEEIIYVPADHLIH